jgi:hypothetical protein
MSVTFDNTIRKAETTIFKKVDIDSMPQISIRLPLKKRIINSLKRGPLTVQELAEELEDTQVAVRARLNEMRDKSEAMRLDNGKWGLAAHDF